MKSFANEHQLDSFRLPLSLSLSLSLSPSHTVIKDIFKGADAGEFVKLFRLASYTLDSPNCDGVDGDEWRLPTINST
jgi:hypothetical protein